MRFCIGLFFPILALAAAPPAPDASIAKSIRHALDLAGQRQFDSSATILKQLLERVKQDNQTFWIAPLLNDLGTVCQEEGKFFDAEKYYRQAIAQMDTDAEDGAAAKASPLGNLGSLYYEAGLLTKATEYLSRSVRALREAKFGGVLLAKSLNNLGVVYLAQHKDEMAVSSAQDALKIWALDGEDAAEAAYSYSLLGAAFYHFGQPANAEPALEKALELWARSYGPDDVRTAKGKVNLGSLYFEQGELAKAKPYFDEARPVFQKTGLNDRFVLHFLDVDAALQKKLGNGKEAKNLRLEHDRLQSAGAAHSLAAGMIDVSGFMASK